MSKANNSLLMKEQNRTHVLRLIRLKPVSRAEISRETGLTRAAVSIIVDKLIEEKLVVEGEAVKSTSGRHPTLLELNNKAFYAYGIDITRDGCHLSLCDFRGEIIKKDFFEFEENDDDTINAITEKIDRNYENVLGVGISAPGPIDIKNGMILEPPSLKPFKNYNIVEAVKKRLELPVFFEKDTNALALNEKNITNKNNFLYILADHGLGGAFIKDDALFKGANGQGCEIGHISLNVNGEKCSCGNRGCASLYTSVQAITKKAEAKDYDELCTLAFNGQSFAIDALKYQGKMLGYTLVTFVNLFEPERIILGGEIKKALWFLKPEIQRILKMHRLSQANDIIIDGSMLDDRASSPAQMVLENYFTKGIL